MKRTKSGYRFMIVIATVLHPDIAHVAVTSGITKLS